MDSRETLVARHCRQIQKDQAKDEFKKGTYIDDFYEIKKHDDLLYEKQLIKKAISTSRDKIKISKKTFEPN